jgi:hypothetical protein
MHLFAYIYFWINYSYICFNFKEIL